MNKKQYITPELTVVTIKAERGFAGSNPKSILSVVLNGAGFGLFEAPSVSENWLEEENLFGEETWD